MEGKRPFVARQSGIDMNLLSPSPRQQFVETVDRMSVDHAREHIAQVGIRFDVVELAGLDQRADHRSTMPTAVAAGEEMILAAQRYHPFILPMSGRK
jgi:hypothetical protein